MKTTLDKNAVFSFLFFGYIPQIPADLRTKVWVSSANKKDPHLFRYASENDLLKIGSGIFQSIFADIEDGVHIVPLSGGLDSRAVLAGLLSSGMKEQVTTVTFGVPGTLDYEIGNLVARCLGTKHVSIDLSHVQLDTQVLTEVAMEGAPCAFLFDSFYNRLIAKKFGKNAIYWSGFMGDPLAGSHLLPKDSPTWVEAISKFANRYRFTKSVNLADPSFDPMAVLPQQPILRKSVLSYDEQLDFAVRQQGYIKPLVFPTGYDYRAPFLCAEWVKFILNVPREYRRNQYLYKEILKAAYPRVFSLPVKNNLGLPLGSPKWRRHARRLNLYARALAKRLFPSFGYSVNPGLNYIDFDRGLRERDDLKTVVYDNLKDLKKRDIVVWLDIDKIWTDHQQHKGDFADALTLLASLEINLKAQEVHAK